jgi:hypothetical protein
LIFGCVFMVLFFDLMFSPSRGESKRDDCDNSVTNMAAT